MLVADRHASEELRDGLAAYLSDQVDTGERLVCASSASCRASVPSGSVLVEGQLSHVGACYSLSRDDMPLRILVVPKQVGGSLDQLKGRGVQHVTVSERGAQVDSAKGGRRPFPRTPHMDGTALALKVLVGLPVDGPETVRLGQATAHVFDCFAMVNATLCSRVRSDASGQGTPRMFERCQVHLRRSIEILRPNIVVAQGWERSGWSPSQAAAAALGATRPPKNSFVLVDAAHGSVALVAVVHPSRNWATPTAVFREEIVPALVGARDSVLSR